MRWRELFSLPLFIRSHNVKTVVMSNNLDHYGDIDGRRIVSVHECRRGVTRPQIGLVRVVSQSTRCMWWIE